MKNVKCKMQNAKCIMHNAKMQKQNDQGGKSDSENLRKSDFMEWRNTVYQKVTIVLNEINGKL